MIDREFLLDPNSHSSSDLSSAKSRPWLASPWPWTMAIAVFWVGEVWPCGSPLGRS
ncbi:hypothetical protein NON20_15515 [Synechocystis sp. B12]|nr:hypothetical protein NON20_15515 [Synechocystis sp. B12]